MGKLVRDKIPDIIQQSGRTPHVVKLTEEAYRAALSDKLQEEVAEMRAAHTTDTVIQEAADVLEVLIAIAAVHGVTLDTLVEAAQQKRAERGGFERRLWLESANQEPTTTWTSSSPKPHASSPDSS